MWIDGYRQRSGTGAGADADTSALESARKGTFCAVKMSDKKSKIQLDKRLFCDSVERFCKHFKVSCRLAGTLAHGAVSFAFARLLFLHCLLGRSSLSVLKFTFIVVMYPCLRISFHYGSLSRSHLEGSCVSAISLAVRASSPSSWPNLCCMLTLMCHFHAG